MVSRAPDKTRDAATDSEWPAVSIVVPVRNEASFIERCVEALLAQDYEGDCEVVCVDGLSDDGTRAIIQDLAARDPRVRLVDNPRRITPAALNIGIAEARGDMRRAAVLSKADTRLYRAKNAGRNRVIS